MAMPDLARRYTVDEVLAFPSDGNRYELVDGELLVTPAPRPRHQLVLTRLVGTVSAYLSPVPELGVLFVSPADITWGGSDRLVQPDLFVIPPGEVSDTWVSARTLLLAVEVVSPRSSRHDRVTKRRLYQRQGVRTYWIVDADARLVEVWRPGDERPEIVTNMLRWKVADDAAELEIDLEELFGW